MNFKIIYISCYLNKDGSVDNDKEIIRTIIYDIVSRNMMCWLALDTSLTVHGALYFLNVVALIVAQMKSSFNNYYYLEAFSSLAVTIFFSFFKKEWEAKDRAIFAEKYRFEKLYSYSRDLIKGLNGHYLNISNDFMIYCDSKMKNLLNHVDSRPPTNTNCFQINNINFQSNVSIKINENNDLFPIGTIEHTESRNNLSIDALNIFESYVEEDSRDQDRGVTERKLSENLKIHMLKPATQNFNSIGVYKLETSSTKKYFDVHFRKFCLGEKNSINDIMVYDITELVTSKQKIIEEGIIIQKIMAKLIHEFKTPFNSIIGLIGSIEESLRNFDLKDLETTMKHLHIVRNLSNYVVFLISDIIHFTNKKSLEEVHIGSEIINLKEISNFGIDVLNSLLRCNIVKHAAIQSELEFDDRIESLLIKSDDIRIKQIILNFVSNAVKFTKAGLIKLKCTINPGKKCVMFTVSDTGVGFSENEKAKLFNDFKMIKNDSVDNSLGSGLGLSICKSLASILKMEISVNSVPGEGSEFSLEIPIKSDLNINKSFGEMIRNDKQSPRVCLKRINYLENDEDIGSELNCRDNIMIHELKSNYSIVSIYILFL